MREPHPDSPNGLWKRLNYTIHRSKTTPTRTIKDQDGRTIYTNDHKTITTTAERLGIETDNNGNFDWHAVEIALANSILKTR